MTPSDNPFTPYGTALLVAAGVLVWITLNAFFH